MQKRVERLLSALAWIVLLAAAFNFTPALFSSESLSESALWTKAAKDVPVVLLFVALVVACGLDTWPARIGSLWRSLRETRPSGLVASRPPVEVAMAVWAAAILAMAVVMAVSLVLIAPLNGGSLVSARYYLLYPLLGVVIAYAPAPRLPPLAVGLVTLACLQTLVGILDYCGVFGQTFYFGHIELFGYLYPRAIGTLGNPNNLGIFQALALIVLASTGALRERRAQVAFAVIAFGILLSFSKTAVTALAVTAFLSFIAAGGRLRSARTLQIGLAFVVLMALVAGSRIGGAPGLEGIFGSRADTAQNAIDAWLSGPVSTLLGNGFASGTAVTADGTISEVVIDNMILALGVEGGLIGLLVFATVVLSGLRLTWMAPARDPLATVARRFGLFLVIYTPLAVNFRLFPGALFFWLLVGLAAGSARRAAPA